MSSAQLRGAESEVEEFTNSHQYKCPECGLPCTLMGRNFKAPKKDDSKQWEKVRFLVEHGFVFHTLIVEGHQIGYPATLSEAKRFVIKYAKYVLKNNKVDGNAPDD